MPRIRSRRKRLRAHRRPSVRRHRSDRRYRRTTFAEAEKLVQVEFSGEELAQAAGNWRSAMAPLYERRVGPRKVALRIHAGAVFALGSGVARPTAASANAANLFAARPIPEPLPANDEDIAFAPVTQLSRWIEQRKLTSERLTNIYLARLEQFNPKLRCVITLTRELALQQARQADQEIAAGKYRGPLHGIPWGAKDLLDTAGIRDHLWRGAVSRSRARERCGGGAAAE